MKRTLLLSIATLALGGMIAVPGFAQTSNASGAGPGVYDPGHPRVNEVNRREQNQQNRIANGEKSGQLTPRESATLERQQGRIQQREARDMAQHNGHLTRREQHRLNRAQNRDSRHIYAKKHNHRVR